jgi:hypothetical protein
VLERRVAGIRCTLVVGLVVALSWLTGCSDRSDQPVRTSAGSATDGPTPSTPATPDVATPSAGSPAGSPSAPSISSIPTVDEAVLLLVGPAGLAAPGLGAVLGIEGLAPPGAGVGGAGGGGGGAGGPTGEGPGGANPNLGPGTGGPAGNGLGGGQGQVGGGQGGGGQGGGAGGQGNGNGTGTGGGQGNTAFCSPARALDAALNAVGAARGPGTLRSAVARARSAFPAARAAAPPSLVGDVDVLADAYGQLFSGMEAAGYDLNRLSPGAFSPLLTPEVKASSGRLHDHVKTYC